MKGKHRTEKEIRQIRQLYPDFSNEVLGEVFGRNAVALGAIAHKLGLKKSAERKRMATAKTQFKPGLTVWNKGMRGLRVSPATEFKPGQMPHTLVPIGTEVTDPDGYRKRKVSDHRDRPSRRNWIFVHVALWVEHHGPVPKGQVVTFIDGNRQNIVIENLQLLSRRQLMARNSVHTNPPELVELIYLTGRVRRRINKIEREQRA